MIVTLVKDSKKIKIKKGFSLRFFLFGSLNYLFSGRFVKFIFSLVWSFITLIWLVRIERVNDFIGTVFDKLADLFGGNIAENLLKFYDYFITNINADAELIKIDDYSFTNLALAGMLLFVLVHILVSFTYKNGVIRRLKKQGFVVVNENLATNNVENVETPIIPHAPAVQEESNLVPPVTAAIPAAEAPVPPDTAENAIPFTTIQSQPFHYQTNNTRAQIRSAESKRIIELHLLNEAYAAGMISYEVYIAKKQALEN